ncbi:MAG TPA: GlsB/YeaQ/YmgE family stress response membrane protein [Acidimicrobiales bacterium]
MSIVAWIVVGFLAGGLARVATGAKKRGCLGTVVVGILGGLIGGSLFNLAGSDGITHFGLWSILVAFVGACALLFLLEIVGGRGQRNRR